MAHCQVSSRIRRPPGTREHSADPNRRRVPCGTTRTKRERMSIMDCATARARLLAHPEEFLRYYPVQCAGASAPNQNAVNLRQYHINKHPDGHRGATRPGFLGIRLNIASFMLQNFPTVNGASINQAHVVPMVNYNSNLYNCPNLNGNINAMPYYQLDGAGNGLMVTGELSGCCFCWLLQGGGLWCIHVQPKDGIDAVALQDALRAQGQFALAPGRALGTYGRRDYPNLATRASVIGVRRAGNWNLFAQTSNDSFRTVSGAYRIYPAPGPL